jgi:hypothetical protein
VLGVKRDANESRFAREYRKLARKHHPDVNPGDKIAEDKFKELNEPTKYSPIRETQTLRSARTQLEERSGVHAAPGWDESMCSSTILAACLAGRFQRFLRDAFWWRKDFGPNDDRRRGTRSERSRSGCGSRNGDLA